MEVFIDFSHYFVVGLIFIKNVFIYLLLFKGLVHPKKEDSVIISSPSCCFTVQLYEFICFVGQKNIYI